MKYLITILLICSGLISCTVYENNVITSVSFSEGYYTYTANGANFKSKRLIYNVGDTVKFTK